MSSIDSLEQAILIRTIQGDEVATFRTLRLEALRDNPTAFGADYQQDINRPDSFGEVRVHNGQGDGDVVIYVAEDAGELVGMAGVYRPDNPKVRYSGTLWGVYVRPAWRGRGLGRQVSQACVEWARAKGLDILKLGVTIPNPPAVRCYESLGFRSYGIEPKTFMIAGQYYDLMRMFLELNKNG